MKHIVDAHGGTIAAGSDGEGRGATFIVELPVRCDHRISTPPDSGSLSKDAADFSELGLGGLKVLVVDDDDDGRMLIGQILTQHGAVVAEAASASSAFIEVERFRPDVLISDIAMPGGDGYGLMRAVRALPPERGGKTPAIAVTAHARFADGERAFAAGFQSHLSKPVDLFRLLSMVKTLGTETS